MSMHFFFSSIKTEVLLHVLEVTNLENTYGEMVWIASWSRKALL